jgi:membrane protein YdbS with pleckstrin-like domain
MEDKNVLFRVKPNFNIIYEMFMPTGRKIRNTLVILILFIIAYFFLTIALHDSDIIKAEIIQKNNVDVYSLFNNIAIFIIIILVIKLIVNIVIQVWQYNSIKYTFYEDYLEYEDTFLNQHKKTLRYDNIKEIEIRRTIWDRINGYGIIIIYSNAEKSADNGLILYAAKDPDETYAKIDEIIHRKNSVQKESASAVISTTDAEASFKDSLK